MTSIDYHQLKMGNHGLPSWDGLVAPTIEIGMQKEHWNGKLLKRVVADSLNLPSELRNLTYEKYPDDEIITNRLSWALSKGASAGIFARPRRGMYQVTELGKELFYKYGYDLNAKIIQSQPQYIAHQVEIKKRKEEKGSSAEFTFDNSAPESEDEIHVNSEITLVVKEITKQIENYNSQIADDLLNRIREAEPQFFEHLVVDLLVKMGYQGVNGNAIVTPRSHDGGIDGVINQDPLGTSTVYLQAKRYQANNIVQRPSIEQFYGALNRLHADRGVFITTSSFSQQAIQTAKSFSIVLIDGLKLTNLMLKYRVGVEAKHQFNLFSIDEDYFDYDEL
ncbi:restriction endonuclease [Secundilactobacillus pentosiphilus]|uniref:Restriction endonuclease n=1 Tax=Secundilactobacillus pentosiphilus TaxID=1714682 RepID=A0A1Z5IPM1_9LACO|nr:restriction endonuclease [Secundilactobacillus pentosiphilus]GAX03695.1 restriction endonuclease [Secundilactobacillus pentosiphilus]